MLRDLTLYLLIGLVAALVGLLLLAERRGWRRGCAIFKPAASCGFIAVALWLGALGSTYGQLLLVGLVLAFGGDVLLLARDSRKLFLAGLVSFLAGHVLYTVAFVALGVDWRWSANSSVPLVVVAAIVLRWLMPHVQQRMRLPVVTYIVVISAMVAVGAGTVAAGGPPTIIAGAFGFFLSDLAVARERFVESSFTNRAWGLPLYYASQLLLATTVTTG